MEDYVGVERVQTFLAFKSPRPVYRLVAKGLPHRKVAGQLKFRLGEIERWIGEHDEAGTAEIVPLRRRTA